MRPSITLARRGSLLAGSFTSRAAAAGPSPQPSASGQPSDGSRCRVALVQGSSRGLGLEFARQLLQRPDHAVVATCRTPSAARELQELQRQHGSSRLAVVQLDPNDEASIAAAAEHVAAQHSHLDLLVNASGVLHDATMTPETGLARVTMDSLLKCFQVVRAGPTDLHRLSPAISCPCRAVPQNCHCLQTSCPCMPHCPAPAAERGGAHPGVQGLCAAAGECGGGRRRHAVSGLDLGCCVCSRHSACSV